MRAISKTIWMLTIATAILGSTMSCHSGKDNSEGEEPLAVTVATPTIDSVVLHQQYPGFIIANRDAAVVARVNGQITAKHYTNGQMVQQGAPLFSIESTAYQAQLNEAQSKLQSATANNEYCSRQYEAMKKALESDAVSKMDVIQAESNLQQSEADIRSAKAAITTATQLLGYCTVRAPFSGHVAAADKVVGDYVAGEAAPVQLTTVYDDCVVEAVFNIEDNRFLEISDTRQGKEVDYDHVRVSFGDSIAGSYTGKLNYVAPTVQKATGTIEMRIQIENPAGELKNGMYCNIDLPYAIEPRAMLIKDAAIGTDQLGKYIYVVNDSNRVVYTPIEIGQLYQDTLRIVNSGLKPTDRYVTKAMLKVRDGMTIKPE